VEKYFRGAVFLKKNKKIFFKKSVTKLENFSLFFLEKRRKKFNQKLIKNWENLTFFFYKNKI